MIDDVKFFAWLDGELEAQEAAEIEVLVAADPELRRRAEAHRALVGRVRAAFDPVAEAPVPEWLLETVHSDRFAVVDLGAAPKRRWFDPFPAGLQWAAMAATLVVGIVTGTMIGGGEAGPIADEDGRLVAAAGLERALDTRLASAPGDTGPRILLTFRDGAGNICRSFSGAGSDGLACRDDGDWRIRGLFQSPEGQSGQFRMASGQDPRLAELIEAGMAGEPFDAAAERQARDRGWK